VLICMPMIPEAVVAMLATVRIGAIHSVFGGFAASLATRIDDARPKFCHRRRHARRKPVRYKPRSTRRCACAYHFSA
jgi:propionyl-CoA synthetase